MMKKLLTYMKRLCRFAFRGKKGHSDDLFAKAEAGDAEAQGILAEYYYYGMGGVMVNYHEALKWARKSAGHGNPDGMFCLGNCYMSGGGVEKNEKEAVRWYRKAADMGHLKSMSCLGRYYKGIDRDKAVYWYEKIMDVWYDEYGELSKIAEMELKELGVSYNPGRGAG